MRRSLGVALGAAAAAACVFSTEVIVRSHMLLKPLAPGLVNGFNLEEQLGKGYIPEIVEFFAAGGSNSIDSTRAARVLGQVLLEKGQFGPAQGFLERAYAKEGRPELRAEAAWLISQLAYWDGRFLDAARWARIAKTEGRLVPQGWIRFLESPGTERIHGGSSPGARFSVPMIYGRPDLIRVAARVNDNPPEELVLDSGASLSLMTESTSRRLGVERVPDAVAAAYGLHQVEFPLHFGWLRTVQIGAVTVNRVPVGILSDEALSFQTTVVGKFKLNGVLGAHFMKDFDWRLEYRDRHIQAVRLDPATLRGGKSQNVFLRRLKPMVRASFNQEPWFLFLLDTGSEPTMVTRSGLRRSRTNEVEGTYPMTIEGIGKSRVSWAKTSDAAVGVDRFMVRFKDLVIKEDADGIADGVVGNSFLQNFDCELRFSSMTLSLERPHERRLRETGPEETLPGIPPR